MKILVTGGLGFIGSHLIKKILINSNHNILNIDAKTYCSMPESLKKYKNNKNYSFKKININNFSKINNVIKGYQPNLIFHLAAESHVDNSIKNPNNFINTNIIGTYNLLNSSFISIKNKKNFKFIHISTDEVYGSLSNKYKKSFTEKTKFNPNSPYSSSKASSDLLVRAWNKTYNLPTITTNCVNNFGKWQFPEKLIPVVIYCCINKIKIPVYGKGQNIREWIYVNDHVDFLFRLSQKGKIGETYNIGSGIEFDNLQLIKIICKYFDTNYPSKMSHQDLISFVEDRPGHDFRYSLNSNKIKKIISDKKMKKNFYKNLYATIDWYIINANWLFKSIKSIK